MKTKILFPILTTSIVATMAIYFFLDTSYEKSIRAKYHYEIGEYRDAYSLAKEAFGLDVYNRMASTIMAQSTTSLKYVKYIEMGKSYMVDINEIATHEYITDQDKAKIRIVCEIMMESYVKLAPSVITDKELIEKSTQYYNRFKELYEKVTK